MEKRLLEDFVRKYTLGGAIEHVTWESDGSSVSVSATPEDKQVMSFVTAKSIDIETGDFSIYDTSQLRSLLSVLDDNLNVKVVSEQGIPLALEFRDESKSRVKFVLADPQTIPTAPQLPPLKDFEMEISVDDAFMTRFTKGTSALSDVDSFAVVQSSEGTKFVIGHSDMNTTRISLDVDSVGDTKGTPMFSSTHLKNIFLANRDSSEAVVKISDRGIMYIGFEGGEYKCDYYLLRLTSLTV